MRQEAPKTPEASRASFPSISAREATCSSSTTLGIVEGVGGGRGGRLGGEGGQEEGGVCYNSCLCLGLLWLGITIYVGSEVASRYILVVVDDCEFFYVLRTFLIAGGWKNLDRPAKIYKFLGT